MGKSHATREVRRKSDRQIERETARRWADRALACLSIYKKTNDPRWLARATAYRQEALEHAVLVGDGGRLVGALDREIGKIK